MENRTRALFSPPLGGAADRAALAGAAGGVSCRLGGPRSPRHQSRDRPALPGGGPRHRTCSRARARGGGKMAGPARGEPSVMNSQGAWSALIVDDEWLVREELKGLLAGYPEIRVEGEAGSGRQAAELLAGRSFDVIFLDIRCPAPSVSNSSSRRRSSPGSFLSPPTKGAGLYPARPRRTFGQVRRQVGRPQIHRRHLL